MKKDEYIKRYGEDAWKRHLEQTRQWRKANPVKVDDHGHVHSRKCGRGYARKLIYGRTGIPGEKNKIRALHGLKWRQYKDIIAPESQIHHQWKPNSAEYVGVALVEKDAHMRGFINVIEILDGEVNIFTEKELAGRGELQWQ